MSNRIATLGPEGTDSHWQAKRLDSEVELFETYHAAIEHAKKYKTRLLVPASVNQYPLDLTLLCGYSFT